MRIEPARPEHAGALLDLIRGECLPPSVLPYSPYGQRGALPWLADSIASSRFTHDLVLDGTEKILGYAQYRLDVSGEVFLNYLCVDRTARGQGIGSKLLSAVARSAPGSTELDAFDVNHAALRLYAKHHFEPVARGQWLLRVVEPIEAKHGAREWRPDHERFGFSMSTVRTPGGPLTIGLLGDHTVRFFDRASFTSAETSAQVLREFPAVRQFLLIDHSRDDAPEDSSVLATYTRYRSVRRDDT